MNSYKKAYIALGKRLQGVKEVLTLGVKANFLDYTAHEREMILKAETILYPTLNYSQFFSTMGKNIFPSLETYIYSDEKIKQTTLFYLLGIPHPRTRIYYSLHHNYILTDFGFPFIAKLPRRSAQGKGIFKIECKKDLDEYLKITKIAYIQEYIPHDKDMRIILINYKPILAYWRKRSTKNFKTNIFQGGTISFDKIPKECLGLASEFSKKCKFNDVGLDMMKVYGKWYVIEANMNYGRKGLEMKGMNLKEIIRDMLLKGELF